MFDAELARFREGLLAVVFDTSDRVQHMTWFARDPEHPLYTEGAAAKFGSSIPAHYRRMDAVVGRALEAAGKDGLVLVLSDHGFAPFWRAVHVNSWLERDGSLTLASGKKDGRSLYRDVDWSRTRAYAVGFCGVGVNMEGREGQGAVKPADRDGVLKELADRLLAFRDPVTKARVIRQVYFAEDIYRGPHRHESPDLILGFESGYRASWQTALGAAPEGPVVEANLSAWSGDHLMDRSVVPGTLLSNRKLAAEDASLEDVAPTILQALGLEAPKEMDGRSLMGRGAAAAP